MSFSYFCFLVQGFRLFFFSNLRLFPRRLGWTFFTRVRLYVSGYCMYGVFLHEGHLRMGDGKTGALPSLEERHAAFHMAMVTDMCLVWGIPEGSQWHNPLGIHTLVV
ncbi:hypothetical protein J3458_012322 [Metarhizium acridum]|uniref:uncharacterized protein n=1 Tax=Metarhizium acridum TaxID=92637 RepID=UPI001C6C6736|nr:hypothetical protein J3458_012322 [Metarhizium acridum]